mgnify:CR=1 FL=1
MILNAGTIFGAGLSRLTKITQSVLVEYGWDTSRIIRDGLGQEYGTQDEKGAKRAGILSTKQKEKKAKKALVTAAQSKLDPATLAAAEEKAAAAAAALIAEEDARRAAKKKKTGK